MWLVVQTRANSRGVRPPWAEWGRFLLSSSSASNLAVRTRSVVLFEIGVSDADGAHALAVKRMVTGLVGALDSIRTCAHGSGGPRGAKRSAW